MILRRTLVCVVSAMIVVGPSAAFAADMSPQHLQDELANAQAQFSLTQQQVGSLQDQANLDASNSRMIAVLQSEALRQAQVDTVSNSTALQQIATSLANAARAQGDINARNSLAIAQIKAGVLMAQADTKLANSMAIGRPDQIANAQAQSNFLHQLADLISSTLAEQNMSNAKAIGEIRADAIRTPALAQEANGIAMGANSLLAADAALQAAELNVSSVNVGAAAQGDALLQAAREKLNNAQVRAGQVR